MITRQTDRHHHICIILVVKISYLVFFLSFSFRLLPLEDQFEAVQTNLSYYDTNVYATFKFKIQSENSHIFHFLTLSPS